jgi:hypothetical protein
MALPQKIVVRPVKERPFYGWDQVQSKKAERVFSRFSGKAASRIPVVNRQPIPFFLLRRAISETVTA